MSADGGASLRWSARGCTCLWCRGLDTEPADGELCRSHLAEHEGLSLAELERGERLEAAECRASYAHPYDVSDADPGL